VDVKAGVIYWVTIEPTKIPPGGLIGHEQHSRRPWVVVSRLLVNRQGSLVVGVPLTRTDAEKTTHPPHRIRIPATEISKDIGFTGEIRNSVALTDQIRAIDKRLLEKKMGTLSATGVASIGLGLLFMFDLR
jgi:mRNA-degrading endonuclease toxin of MazEF toxin-antitoxin module